MLATAFAVLVTATILSIINDNDIPTVIPNHTVVVPVINALCALVCLILFFIKENYKLQCLILFVQGICTALTGYEVLGAFLYSAMFIILFCNKFFTTQALKKVLFLSFFWLLTLLSLIPFGLQRFVLELVISAFFAGFYAYIYKKLEHLLAVLVPAKDTDISVVLPERGSEITLEDFGLTERQIKLTKDYMESKSSYKDLSAKYYLSVSSVKKEMASVFAKFSVRNINELYFLLAQYVIR